MPAPKILVVPGSAGSGADDARLAALAVKELTLADAEVTRLSLTDYPMPLYDPDVEAVSGPPPNAVKLKRMIAGHQGVFLTTPELNASIPPLVKNTIDWVSRVRERGDSPHGVYRGRVFALGSATRDSLGGVRALMALRQVLEIGCGALVLPEQIAVAAADQAFDDMDDLKDPQNAELLRAIARRLVDLSWERLGA
ncbi:MAG: NADPH-dependent FMN reductase [Rhizobiales bacterium]|nr:NADPH-dependent FMN reductase [Hyphomicrobiales bacterium]